MRALERMFGNCVGGKVDINRSDYFQQLDNEFSEVSSEGQIYGLSLRTNLKKFPEVELGCDFSINQYNSIYSDVEYRTQKPYVLLEYQFLDDFSLEADYSKFYYTDYYRGRRTAMKMPTHL